MKVLIDLFPWTDSYNQYREKLAELKQLQEKIAVSDLDEELDEMDLLKCAQMSEVCESLVHSLQIIENPQMRYLLASVSPKLVQQGPRGNRPRGDEPVTYIVAPKLQAGMVKFYEGNQICKENMVLKLLLVILNLYAKADFM